MATVKDRLKEFLRHEGISNSEFARRMGLSVTYVGSMRRSMPEAKVTKIMELFPDLNRDWLLYGEGEMLLSEDNQRGYRVPLLPVSAYAGRPGGFSQGVKTDDCERILSPVKGADFAIRVFGDSMEPEFKDGSVLFIRKIDSLHFIPWGKPMVIDSSEGVLIKVVNPSDESDEYIEAVSINQRYAPQQIPKENIYGLYRVLSEVRYSL